MESKSLEIECPVCDRKMPADTKKCPSCGVDLSTAGMDELEEVARDLSEGKPESAPTLESPPPQPDPTPQIPEVQTTAEPAVKKVLEEPAPDVASGTKEKGGLRRLFGRKRR